MVYFQFPSKWRMCVVLIFLVYGFSYAQPVNFTDAERAKYICGFVRQITWPKKETKLTIGVLESDTKLSDELRRYAIPENLRDKTLTVVSLKNPEKLPTINILYVNKNWNPAANIDSLMTVAETDGFLFITEAALFRQSMINFVALKGDTFYEVNEQALKKAGFTYLSILPLGAIKTKEDWEALFKETKQELDLLKVDYVRLQQEIEKQKQEIARQQKEISKNAAEIAVMTEEIKKRQEQIDAQLVRLTSLRNDITVKQMELKARDEDIAKQMLMIAEKQAVIDEKSRINEQYSAEIAEKMEHIGSLNTEINEYLKTLRMQNVIIVLGILLVVFLAVFGFVVYRNYRQKHRLNQLLVAQNEQITEQNIRIAHQNKDITDSIIYARRIQTALLPTAKMMREHVEMFIFYRPRDIVSGDFYWMSKKEDKLIIVAADCTGHGVPGAFMSMLGVAFLNEIVNKENEVYANVILDKLREHVIHSLNQVGKSEEEYTRDGMDVALCVIDYPSMTLQYAGAYNPLILIREHELIEVKADKMPVAYSDVHGERTFTNNLIPLFPKDCLYMFSDGYADQFGGEGVCKKYSTKRLKSTLLDVYELPMDEQEKAIAKQHDEWKGDNKQIDDVLLIGIRV